MTELEETQRCTALARRVEALERENADLTERELKTRVDFARCFEQLSAAVEESRKCRFELQFNVKKMQDLFFMNKNLLMGKKALRDHIRFLENKCAGLENELNAVCSSREFRTIQRFHRITGGVSRLICAIRYCFFCKFPLALSVSPRKKELLRYRGYRKYAEYLKNSPEFLEYERTQRLIAAISPDAETGSGLQIPQDMPLTSIIIPLPRHLDLVVKCLTSIFDSRPQVPFEILIVDDGSLKHLDSLAEEFPGVRLVRNEKNPGFSQNANCGVQEAKGGSLLFLHSDIAVLPGWLDELAVALFHHPEAGMIGSRIIRQSTGKLHESGNLFCRNGEIVPLGRGADPMAPEYTCFREIDFCTVCIIVGRNHFEAVGGFDPLNTPVGGEESDLALKFMEKGWKNYVMPLARVLYLDREFPCNVLETGGSAGNDRQMLMQKWGDFLSKNAKYDCRSQAEKERIISKPRVLFIDAEIPMADRGSGGMDSVFFMNYLIKRGYDVVFHGEYTAGYVSKYTSILLRMGVQCVYLPQQTIWDFFRDEGKTFQYVFVCRIYQAQCFDRLIRTYAPQAIYIFDTVDVHFIREYREAELAKSESKTLRAMMTEKVETTMMSRADAVIVISSDEKQMLESKYGIKRIFHIPQAREVFGRTRPFAEREGMVFIGSAHLPNMDGLKYYVEEILPLLEQQGVNLTLTVIGEALRNELFRNPEYSCVAHCPKIRFAGFVADLGDYLNRAKITIAPLRYGAGTKGKVASSMAYGVPCVSSPFGTEGTGMIDGEDILVASDAADFAAAIIRLTTEETLWGKISDNGIRFLQKHYAPETVEKMTDVLMAEAAEHRRRMNELLPQVKNAQEAFHVSGTFPQADVKTAEELVFSVLQNCGIPTASSITSGTVSSKTQQKLLSVYPHTFFTDTLLTMEGKYDFILLPHSAEAMYKIESELACARELLYDGGRVFFTVPRNCDLAALFGRLTEMLKYQQVFAASSLNGYSESGICLCAVKAIPKEDDDPETNLG